MKAEQWEQVLHEVDVGMCVKYGTQTRHAVLIRRNSQSCGLPRRYGP
jgi:hypothetical protein